ncbi:integrase arm-type DNA-binding domain-containing protein [Klebsiella variicola]|uniref:integrase arm-type DNA-binding domain-containing protein n=1 Tax=Klebsiella variicola TaxID=244366 RepID=UPI00374EB6DC
MEGIQTWRASHAPLTNNEILKAKPRKKDFPLHDGDGLFLLVKTTGKKLWRFRYQRPNSGSRTNSQPRLIPGPYARNSSSDTRPAFNHARTRYGSTAATRASVRTTSD